MTPRASSPLSERTPEHATPGVLGHARRPSDPHRRQRLIVPSRASCVAASLPPSALFLVRMGNALHEAPARVAEGSSRSSSGHNEPQEALAGREAATNGRQHMGVPPAESSVHPQRGGDARPG